MERRFAHDDSGWGRTIAGVRLGGVPWGCRPAGVGRCNCRVCRHAGRVRPGGATRQRVNRYAGRPWAPFGFWPAQPRRSGTVTVQRYSAPPRGSEALPLRRTAYSKPVCKLRSARGPRRALAGEAARGRTRICRLRGRGAGGAVSPGAGDVRAVREKNLRCPRDTAWMVFFLVVAVGSGTLTQSPQVSEPSQSR